MAVNSKPKSTATETNANKENEKLKKQIETMQDQINALMETIKNFTSQPSVESVEKADGDYPKNIEVISMTNAHLILSTTGKADGRKYDFKEQFTSRYIPEDDLRLIVNAMHEVAQNGSFFINDKDFVKKCGLSGAYQNMLNSDTMKKILNMPYHDFVATYSNALEGQKKIIESMVLEKRWKDEDIDANILMFLNKTTGKDFIDIEPLLKEV